VESTDRGVGPSDLGDLPLEPDRRIRVAAADDDERPHVGHRDVQRQAQVANHGQGLDPLGLRLIADRDLLERAEESLDAVVSHLRRA
jgi:hypothetical protein